MRLVNALFLFAVAVLIITQVTAGGLLERFGVKG